MVRHCRRTYQTPQAVREVPIEHLRAKFRHRQMVGVLLRAPQLETGGQEMVGTLYGLSIMSCQRIRLRKGLVIVMSHLSTRQFVVAEPPEPMVR